MLPGLEPALLVKALGTALVVVSAARVAQRAGPVWAALVAALPVSTGPAYVLLAFDHDAAFIAGAALGSAVANAATAAFLTVHASLARRLPLLPSLGAALAAWLALCAGLQHLPWQAGTALVLNLAAYGAALALLRPPLAMAGPPRARGRDGWRDLLLRALVVAVFVVALVTLGERLGPLATGMLAVFPVSLGSLILLSAPSLGTPATADLAMAALRPMLGFALMLLTLHVAAPVLGSWWALAAALAVSLTWTVGLAAMAWRHRPA
ncbi:hypothetical protein [Zavarzinia sp. CC-PAN008]|uniref:hypothetical protein n=1 Tax=Zavarzinia sp. CC-PAN008 TaxID=3243332 RepID=UPI003F7449CF